jgi:hypothetical protein
MSLDAMWSDVRNAVINLSTASAPTMRRQTDNLFFSWLGFRVRRPPGSDTGHDEERARAIVLTNQKGAVLQLSGTQVGLMANADLSGLAITLR